MLDSRGPPIGLSGGQPRFSHGAIRRLDLHDRIGEENQRARLDRWVQFMEAGSWDDLYPVNKKASNKIFAPGAAK